MLWLFISASNPDLPRNDLQTRHASMLSQRQSLETQQNELAEEKEQIVLLKDKYEKSLNELNKKIQNNAWNRNNLDSFMHYSYALNLDSAKFDLKQQKEALREDERELSKLQREESSKQSAYERLKREEERLENEIQKIRNEISNKNDRITKHLQGTKFVQATVDRYENDISKLKGKLQPLERSLSREIDDLKTAESELHYAKNNTARANDNIVQRKSKIARAEQAKTDAENSYKEAKEHAIKRLNTEKKELTREIAQTKSALNETEQRFHESRNQYQTVLEEFSKTEEEFETLEEQLIIYEQRTHLVSRASKSVSSAKSYRVHRSRKTSTYEEQLAETYQHIKELHAIREEIKKELETIQANLLKDPENESLVRDKKALEDSISDIGKEITDLGGVIDSINANIKEEEKYARNNGMFTVKETNDLLNKITEEIGRLDMAIDYIYNLELNLRNESEDAIKEYKKLNDTKDNELKNSSEAIDDDSSNLRTWAEDAIQLLQEQRILQQGLSEKLKENVNISEYNTAKTTAQKTEKRLVADLHTKMTNFENTKNSLQTRLNQFKPAVAAKTAAVKQTKIVHRARPNYC